jgi:hypothetical protein
MLPKNKLWDRRLERLRIFEGDKVEGGLGENVLTGWGSLEERRPLAFTPTSTTSNSSPKGVSYREISVETPLETIGDDIPNSGAVDGVGIGRSSEGELLRLNDGRSDDDEKWSCNALYRCRLINTHHGSLSTSALSEVRIKR